MVPGDTTHSKTDWLNHVKGPFIISTGGGAGRKVEKVICFVFDIKKGGGI